jgi:SAM-dependent methyltransferase
MRSVQATEETRVLQREEAWNIFPFPCIGQMRFLDFSLATMPSYSWILARLRDSGSPAKLLDVGCCFGQDLRRLVADGAPSEDLVGLDLEPQFLLLGYDLFADRESYKGQMVAGDIFDKSPDGPLALLKGSIDIAHAASFFHLFSWKDQVNAGVQLVRLMKNTPEALVLGRHLGSSIGEERLSPTNSNVKMYFHCPDSFKKLWAVISERTGTNWNVNAWLEETTTYSKSADKKKWMDNRIELLYFEVRRTHG